MPKIIRIKSPQNKVTSGYIENNFNQDIYIKPFSKIGLYSASIPLSRANITIDNTNDQLAYKTSTTGTNHLVTLTQGRYTTSDFIRHIEQMMNNELTVDQSTDIGFQWRVNILTNNKLSIGYIKGEWGETDYTNLQRVTYANGRLQLAGTSVTGYATTARPLSSSCGILRGVLYQARGLRMGLLTLDYNGADITDNFIKYAIGIDTGTDKFYNYWVDGNKIVTTELADDDDVIDIEITDGEIRAVVYRADNPLFSQKLADNDHLNYRAFCYLDQVNARVDGCRWTPDSRYTATEKGVTFSSLIPEENNYIVFQNDIVDEDLGAVPLPPAGTASTGKVTIQFTKQQLQNILGFYSSEYQSNLKASEFIAIESLAESTAPTNILLELPDLKFESYDGNQHERRSIVAYIPYLSQTLHRLVYQPDNVTMLDIGNPQPLTLRRFKVRVLDANENLLILEDPGLDVTLIID